MKKHMNFVIVFIVITGSFIMNEALAIDPALGTTLNHYFTALKEGDIHTLSLLLSDDLSQRRGELIENPRYSGFLKKYYEGAQFKVIRFNPLAGNCMAVDIEVVSYGQTSFNTITFVEKDGKWKLLKEKKSYSDDLDSLIDCSDADCSLDPACLDNVTILNPADYEIANLQVGDEYYLDRTYTLTSVPSELTEGEEEWIKTKNNDKANTSVSFLEFTISQDSTIYIGYDTRATSPPDWLTSKFVSTPLIIGVSEEMGHFDVYKQNFSAGTNTLGGNLASWAAGAESNYIVIVKPYTPVPEICDNGIDDDLDSLIDCSDADCSLDLACLDNVTILNPADYEIANLQVGDEYYLDRTYTLTSVPSELTEGEEEWIKTKNNDKANTSVSFLEFTILQDSTIYIGYDTRATSPPDWLTSKFVSTPLIIGVSEEMGHFDVYKQNFSAGTNTLGGNLASWAAGAESNYIVIVKPYTPVPEICDNGIDDDLDSLIDCSDADCSLDLACLDNVTILNPADYEIANLQVGDEYYLDRTYTLSSVPSELTEGEEEWIKTKNNDKANTSVSFLEFTILQDSTIYIGYDTRATSPPDWLTSKFVSTPLIIGVSEEMGHFDVYKQNFSAGTNTLGGNLASWAAGAESNYIVIVKPYTPVPEICDNGIDDDLDSLIDCSDADCSLDPACQTCTDADSDGYYAQSDCGTAVDCDDNDPAVNPGADNELADVDVWPIFFGFFIDKFSLFKDNLQPNALGYVVMSHLWSDPTENSLPFLLEDLIPSRPSDYPSTYKQNLLEIGNIYYIDRSYILTSIPDILKHGIWVMTANNDKYIKSENHVSFFVDRPCTVYIAYDSRATSLPDWMGDFNDMATAIETTDVDLNVYSKPYVGGSTIQLGGNKAPGASGAGSNYIVIVVENYICYGGAE